MVHGSNQEFFRALDVSWNDDISITISSAIQKKKAPQGKMFEFFLLKILKTRFYVKNLIH